MNPSLIRGARLVERAQSKRLGALVSGGPHLAFAQSEMPISGLVLTTRAGCEATVSNALRQLTGITVGEPCGARLPIVAEAPTLRASRELTEALMSMDGVAFVDVVSVDFQDEEL